MTHSYTVVVRGNVVVAIEREPRAPRHAARTPLEIGTELASNNRRNGCIDGRYECDDSQSARVFASLCLEYTKALIEKRLAAVNALPVGFESFRAD
jgi:hypothetical protein